MIAVVSLVATGSKYSDSVAEYLKSLSRPQATPTFTGLRITVWEWIEYVQGAWVYEPDRPGEGCQQPLVSDKRLRGDCEDFAVMIAYYVQEYWKHDTYVIILHCSDKPDHCVAFLHVTETTPKRIADQCKAQYIRSGGYYPYQTFKGRIYIAIDWTLCPTWNWDSCSSSRMYEWNDMLRK